MFSFAAIPLAEDDPIFKQCTNQTDSPPPWCYQRKVEEIGDPALCENILKHWPIADGVHGWCYYRLAAKQKECALCDSIKKADLKIMCKRDACK